MVDYESEADRKSGSADRGTLLWQACRLRVATEHFVSMLVLSVISINGILFIFSAYFLFLAVSFLCGE